MAIIVLNDLDPQLTWIPEIGLAGTKPAYSTPLGAMFLADSLNILRSIPSNCVDLVMTSPPFALYPPEGIRERAN